MRILVAIANYGTKNRAYLDRLLTEYRSMPWDVRLVVLSNIPKDLGDDVEVVVGLPTRNPWSLPFGHRKLFADRVDDYDLFIYSEDDTLVTEGNIRAFLEVTELLPETDVAGLLRYEVDEQGHKFCSTMHTHFHWIVESVKSVGDHMFARFSNEHSACYLLTRDQLKTAIASGRFLVKPHEGRYDLLCTAATDPYTQCGLTKVICLTRLDDFMLHHLSNRYVGASGVEFQEMRAQVKKLISLVTNGTQRNELFPTQTALNNVRWDKLYYNGPRQNVLASVPSNCASVLSVGCGAGLTKAALVQRGTRVVAIPLDAVIAESAKAKGIDVLPPDLDEALESLKGTTFQCILLVHVLHHVPHPTVILRKFAAILGPKGTMIIMVFNFRFVRYWFEVLKDRTVPKTTDPYEAHRLHLANAKMLRRWLDEAGLELVKCEYRSSPRCRALAKASFGLLRSYLSPSIFAIARKRPSECADAV